MWMKAFISVSDKFRMCNAIAITSAQMNQIQMVALLCVYECIIHVRRLFFIMTHLDKKMIIKTTHITYRLNIWKITFSIIVTWILNVFPNNRTRLMLSICSERLVAAIISVLHRLGSRAPPPVRYELNSATHFTVMHFFFKFSQRWASST